MHLDAILPIHPLKGDALDSLRAALLVHSLALSGAEEALRSFIVVHPTGMGSLLRPLQMLSDKVRLVAESEVFSGPEMLRLKKRSGWRRQQFIKLAAPRISDAEFFLTLDADNVSLRGFAVNQILQDGRICSKRLLTAAAGAA